MDKRQKILIVDDAEFNREIDLMLLDIQMPGKLKDWEEQQQEQVAKADCECPL